MQVKVKTVEAAVSNIIDGMDALCAAVVAESRNPMDVGNRFQVDAVKQQLKQAVLKLLMLIDIID